MRAALVPVVVASLGCAGGLLPTGPCLDHFDGPALATCEVPGWKGRPYDLVLPDSYDGQTPVPVVLALHGGGGNKAAAARSSCPGGSLDDPSCLHVHGRSHGTAVVYPSGVKSAVGNFRSWNAGGGGPEWRCTGGRACEEGVDDVAYIAAVLDDLEGRVAVDVRRVSATGLSNGGAMSHRLACDLSDRIAAIAPVGGAMQLTTTGSCTPGRPVPVLQVHGTEDPCWRYDGGVPECPIGQEGKKHASVDRTLGEWAAINRCSGGVRTEALPDPVRDGMHTEHVVREGCAAPVELLRIVGGGHTWPNGLQYFGEERVGRTTRDWGSERLWLFLSQQALPEGPAER